MKKDLFKIDLDEANRILSLHESRSNKQYLNIISEVADDPMAGSNPIKSKPTTSPAQTPKKPVGKKGSYENPYTDADLKGPVDILVDEIDGIVDSENLNYIFGILQKYVGKYAIDKTDYYKPKMVSAILRIRNLYYDDEGEKLIDDINSVGTATLPAQSVTRKKQIISILSNPNMNLPAPPTAQKPKAPGAVPPPPSQQKTPLTDAQKLDKAKKCGHATWEDYKNSKWACTPPQQVKTPGGQTTSQTATVTKQIQTSLGTATPTGKITDAELDAILAKLG